MAPKWPGGGGEFHIIVLHHTDCGITRLVGDPAMLVHYFQIEERALKTKAVKDPRAAVTVDVASLRAIRRCRLSGSFQASSMMWRPGLLRSSCRQRRFVLRQFQWIKVGALAFPALHDPRGRDLLLIVSEKLDIPLRERNVRLLASGYASIYEESSWVI